MNTQRLVAGIGISDPDYKTHIGKTVDGKYRKVWVCPVYMTWASMIVRCYCEKSLARRPSYRGCSVSSEWLAFSRFKVWMDSQTWEGLCLDKDILLPGNKVYGPDACVFVPSALNKFLTDRSSLRGDWPIGVSWNAKDKKFKAACNNPFLGKNEFLGNFSSPELAHEAWRQRKHQHACRYAEMQTDPRIASALRERFVIHSDQIEAGNPHDS